MPKQCNRCSVDLIVGDNWYASMAKYGSYRCKKCHLNNHYKYVKTPSGKAAITKWNKSNNHQKSVNKYFDKGKAGVYGIFSDCKLIYIGQTSNSKKRNSSHFSIRNNLKDAQAQSNVSYALSIGELQHDKLRFKMLEVIDDKQSRLDKEQRLIQRYKPLYNDLYV